MKPLVLFSSLAALCAGGLLALSYEGWRDEPSALSSLATDAARKAAEAPAAEPAKTASVQQEEPAEPQMQQQPATEPQQQTQQVASAPTQTASEEPEAKPDATKAEVSPDTSLASFDMVRVEEDGSAVLAGRASPGAKVKVLLSGEVIGEVEASERGEWVFIPDAELGKGAHQMQLEETTKDGKVRLSEQTIALTVPDKSEPKPLIVLSETAKPSKVLQKPEPPAATAEAGDAKAESETKVAAVDTAAKATEPGTDAASKPEAPASSVAGQPAEPKPSVPNPAARALTVDVVDYDEIGRTTFSGRSKPGSRVRVYVNDRFAGETEVAADGSWAMAAARDIEPGSHSLRTDQIGESGNVTERIELPFFRESSERIASLQAQRSGTSQTGQSSGAATTAPASEASEASQTGQASETAQTGEPAQTGEMQTAKPETETAAQPAETAAAEATQAQPDTGPQSTAKADAEVAVATAEVETEAGVTKAENDVQAKEEPAEPAETASAAAVVKQEPDGTAAESATGKVVIQPGNNLWQISRVIYGKGIQYTVIYEANKDQIRNPNRIYPGQIFETPGSTAPESIDPACRQPLAECQ